MADPYTDLSTAATIYIHQAATSNEHVRLVVRAVREAYSILCRYWEDQERVVLEHEWRRKKRQNVGVATFGICGIFVSLVIATLCVFIDNRSSQAKLACLIALGGIFLLLVLAVGALFYHRRDHERRCHSLALEYGAVQSKHGSTLAHKDKFVAFLMNSPMDARRFTQLQCMCADQHPCCGYIKVATPGEFLRECIVSFNADACTARLDIEERIHTFVATDKAIQHIFMQSSDPLAALVQHLLETAAIVNTGSKDEAYEQLRAREGISNICPFDMRMHNGYGLGTLLPL